MLKDVESLTGIIKRAKVSGQQIGDKHKELLDSEFPNMLDNIKKMTKEVDIQGISKIMKDIEKKKNDEFEAKIRDIKIEK